MAVVEILGDAIILNFEDDMLSVTMDRWHERNGHTIAEVMVRARAPGIRPHIHTALLTLTSTRSRQEFAAYCARVYAPVNGRPDWPGIIEEAAMEALRLRRSGEPAVKLADVSPEDATTDLLEGWIPLEGTTVPFGDGGVGKSTLALYLSCAVASGVSFLGLRTTTSGPVLFLDYETNKRVQARRLRKLARGLEIEAPEQIVYKKLTQPVATIGPELRWLCRDHDPALIVLDSLGYAGAATIDAEPTLAVFRVLNSLECPVLAPAHVAKSGDQNKPYGSAFAWNSARSVIEIRKHQDVGDDTIQVGMFHRKANDDKLQRPLGVEIQFLPEITLIKKIDVRDTPLAEHLPLGDRLEALLRDGAQHYDELARRTGAKKETVRTTLRRREGKRRVVHFGDGKWGLRQM